MSIPVTVVRAGPCHVLQVRTKEHDGYEAVQLGFLDKPRRLASRSERGHVASSTASVARSSHGGVQPRQGRLRAQAIHSRAARRRWRTRLASKSRSKCSTA